MNILLWSLLFFGALALLLVLRFKIGVALFLVSMVAAVILYGFWPGVQFGLLAAFESVTTFTLLAIPLFILMGELIFRTGLAGLAIGALDRAMSRLRGRLAYLSLAAGGLFGVLSGSSVASTGVLSGSLLPQMIKRRYNPELGMGAILGAGGLAMVLPPSAVVIVLGATAGIAVGPLLMAGLLPGLLMLVGYLVVVTIQVYGFNKDRAYAKDPVYAGGGQAPADDEPHTSPNSARSEFLAAGGLVLIAVVTLAAIILGVVTPSEAAALGLLATTVVAGLFRRLTLHAAWEALKNTLSITGMIFFLIIAAGVYSQVLAASGVVAEITSGIENFSTSPILVMSLMIVIVILLGLFLESIAIVLLTMPLFMPIVASIGMDPIWFGILMVIAIQIGTVTPPFGMSLFVMRGFVPERITMTQIYRAALPFVLSDLAVILVILFFPAIALALPQLM